MRGWLTGLLLVTLPSPGALKAQDTLLPLGEVVRRVVERDPGVRALGAERLAAASEAHRTETLRLPRLYLNTDVGAGKLVNDVSDVLLTGLSPASVTDPRTRSRLADLSSDRPFVVPGARLENRLFDGGRTRAAIRSAWLNENKAEVAEAHTRQDEAYAAAADFLDLAQARVYGRHLDDYARVAELAAAALDEQVKAGRITEARALIGRAKLNDARAAAENNRDDLRFTSDLLRGKAGLPDGTAFDTRPLESRLEEFALSVMPENPGLDRNVTLQTALLDTRIQEQQVKALSAELSTIGRRVVGEAICAITSGEQRLPVNSNVDLTFTSRELSGVLLVPVDAVFQVEGRNYVYVVNSGRLQLREVQVGASNAEAIVIRSGLRENEMVLNDLEVRPQEGLRVNPRETGGAGR